MKKKDFPVEMIRRFLEPGPTVLVSSAFRGRRNIMTLGWHMVMEFAPSRIGCCIFSALTSGEKIDKFDAFGLTPLEGEKVGAPLIAECFANVECKLVDASLHAKYHLFIFEAVKAHVATSPKYPKTFHYRGDGVFMVSGRNVSHRSKFRPENL